MKASERSSSHCAIVTLEFGVSECPDNESRYVSRPSNDVCSAISSMHEGRRLRPWMIIEIPLAGSASAGDHHEFCEGEVVPPRGPTRLLGTQQHPPEANATAEMSRRRQNTSSPCHGLLFFGRTAPARTMPGPSATRSCIGIPVVIQRTATRLRGRRDTFSSTATVRAGAITRGHELPISQDLASSVYILRD